MTYEEVKEMVASIAEAVGCDFSYYQFKDKPEKPFITYYYGDSDDFMADNSNYIGIRPLVIEFYSEDKDFDNENIIEEMLKSFDMPFERSEVWIDSEKMYEISYNMEVIIDG